VDIYCVRHAASAASLLLAALTGCGCGFRTEASGPGPDAVLDAAPGGSARTGCYGAGAWEVCLAARPTGVTTLNGPIDTDRDSRCATAAMAGWTTTGQPGACFLLGDTVVVAGPTRVTGDKPLVVVAHTSISIEALLDAASHRADRGPPRSAAACPASSQAAERSTEGASGGAGGSFVTLAGDGGQGGDDESNVGLAAPAELAAPARLRGGCAGQTGGAKGPPDAGRGGGGGGAVYLLAGIEIRIAAAINASGAGGEAGKRRSGGSGGGSGGMIVLAAPSILLSGNLVANGGSGSAGGTDGAEGSDGQDPDVTMPLVAAKAPGNGGSGYPAPVLGGLSGSAELDGGGGGGGGAGYICTTVAPSGGGVSSPPLRVVP
jgi:hypothetical protein